MEFKKVLLGYDPDEVDNYLRQMSGKNQEVHSAQQERIDLLLAENSELKQRIDEYKRDEQAISKSLIESQKLADELKGNADKYSELVLSRAKIFYAAWHAYAETLISSLSAEEVASFNSVKDKIASLINAFEGSTSTETLATVVTQNVTVPETADSRPTEKTMGTFVNPIGKVTEASKNVIDLKELIQTDESLEELCKSLGIIPGEK